MRWDSSFGIVNKLWDERKRDQGLDSQQEQELLFSTAFTLALGPIRPAITVEALCYKPEGRWFDSRCHWIFN
jgi:hypothetical protein